MPYILKQSISNLLLVLKKTAPIILLLFAGLFVNIYFFLPDINQLSNGIDLTLLFKLNIFLIVYLAVYILSLLIVGYSLLNEGKKSFALYVKAHFVKLLTDLTRAYNQVLLFSLLLILPGIYKYIRLIFVPFLSMKVGIGSGKSVDILKQSYLLTKPIKVFLILLFIYIIFIPFDLITMVIKNNSIINTFLLSFFSLVPIYYHCLIVAVYKKCKEQV